MRVTLAQRSLFVLLAVCGAGLAYVSTAASDGGTTTAPTTTETTTTAVVTTAPPPTTTGPPATTTAVPAAPPLRPVVRKLDQGCLVVGIVALRLPGHALPLVLGPVAHAPWAKQPAETGFAYPADGSVIAADSASVSAPRCAGTGTLGISSVRDVTLFGGAVSVGAVTLLVGGGDSGPDVVITGLRVGGTPVGTPAPGRRLALGNWGYLEVLRSNNVKIGGSRRLRAAGLVLHLLARRANVPAGTEIQIAFADAAVAAPPAPKPTTTAVTTTTPAAARPSPPTQARQVSQPKRTVRRTAHRAPKAAVRKPKRPSGAPLTVTPRLGRQTFVFPVAGQSSFVDTYGAFRSDVPGGWHHGDDIFAALGTPVVAVATGTLNRVGWERIGGWRLWVRDRSGDEFYYAHLSGYAPLALHSVHVKAGEIIGFVGNSGDAYPLTPPHLHFEVHPRSLLRLQYNGAVDPTTYLQSWTHVERLRAPHPALPRIASLPTAQVKQEAKFIFRELLSDRGLLRHTRRTKATTPARVASSAPVHRSPTVKRGAHVFTRTGSTFDAAPLLFVVLGGVLLAGAGAAYRRRGRSAAAFALVNELNAADELD